MSAPAEPAPAPAEHEPSLPNAAATDTTLWCEKCMAATRHVVAHLSRPEMGAPRCELCRAWVGWECTGCHAKGEERRPRR